MNKNLRRERQESAVRRGRQRLPAIPAKELQDRLRRVLRERFSNARGQQIALARKLELPKTTVSGWFRAVKPICPDPSTLIHLAKELSLSIDWLLLGDGQMDRNRAGASAPLVEQLRMAVEDRLRKDHAASPAELRVAMSDGVRLLEELVQSRSRLLELTRAVVSSGAVGGRTVRHRIGKRRQRQSLSNLAPLGGSIEDWLARQQPKPKG